MKKFIITVTTNWCGMDDRFRAMANEACELDEIAESLAYENFESYGGPSLMAESQGYNPETMSEEDWDALYEEVCESDYYDYHIEEFEGTDEEWEQSGEEIFNKEEIFDQEDTYDEECESDCIGE